MKNKNKFHTYSSISIALIKNKNKFYRFYIISIISISFFNLIFFQFVDGYYELKNIISIIETVYILTNLAITLYLLYKGED